MVTAYDGLIYPQLAYSLIMWEAYEESFLQRNFKSKPLVCQTNRREAFFQTTENF